MGRPLNKKHFGNTNADNVAGEGIASIAVNVAGTTYVAGNAATISAPNITGGTQAVAEVATVDGSGLILTITVTTAGSGYTSAPTVTFAGGDAAGTGTATVATTATDGITFEAFVTGGSNVTNGDIISQKGSKSFRVTTSDGTEKLILSTSVPVAGKMRIKGTDSAGGTYFISKISGRTCTVTQGTGTQFATDAKVGWNLTTAVLDESIVLDNG